MYFLLNKYILPQVVFTLTQVFLLLITSTFTQLQIKSNLDTTAFSNEELSDIKRRCRTPTAFAGIKFQKIFTSDEMIGRICFGRPKKQTLDQRKLEKIPEYVYRFYPETSESLRQIWCQCVKTTDSYIRNMQRP